MKRRLCILLVLTLALLTLSPSVPAHAATATVFTYTGANVTADFYSTDTTGCVATYISIFAGRELRHTPPGPVNRGAGAQIFFDQFNACDFSEAIGLGFTPLAPTDLRIQGSTQSPQLNATLDTVIPISALSGYTAPAVTQVAVHMKWTSLVVINDLNTHGHFVAPGYVVNSHFTDSFRFAAASGSITAGTTNFTPDPSPNAYISAQHSGIVEVTIP